ncbi:hypothetical protein KFL_006920030 [Klebsormidium nitens]|uniref:MYND-type domain-containing protein n=1 Tax=Klebsormidium nitens TaxID=105231 RepID=A0A1Y1IN13_KLENI|nr:hypothetical protein KFL_006920030 [Klebsormidium nitens]|eukprot:GAQ90849.1 hypothetical protein KFL_006920030 [Klebsormidium nitens]
MDEDLEQTVERYATLLTSNDAERFEKGCALIDDACYQSEEVGNQKAESSWAPKSRIEVQVGNQKQERFARIAQELAVYKGSAVLLRLWEGALTERSRLEQFGDASTAVRFFQTSCIAVACLSTSKVVVERCLKELGAAGQKRIAREVYETFYARASRAAREMDPEKLIAYGRLMVATPLKCVANFALASKAFREAMREYSAERSLFEQFGHFLSAEFRSKLLSGSATSVPLFLSDLAMTLAFSTDSQMWALDKGLLKLMAAVYEASASATQRGRNGTPVFRCNASLLHLAQSEPTVEKLRALNALEVFRPYKRNIVITEPNGIDLWEYIEAKLLRRTVIMRELSSGRQFTLSAQMSGSGTPVVCSWKHCTAGPEPVEGTRFEKCGHCKVARYCSKEHQILHWRTHKIHCKASLAQDKASS